MVDVYRWNDSSSTSTLNSQEPPAGLPENMAPSQVNNAMRALMAAARQMYGNQLDWRPMGSAGSEQLGDEHVVSYVTVNSFSVGEDASTTYVVDRRVRAVGADTGTIYGRVDAATTTTITTVNMDWDDQAVLANDADLVLSVGPDPSNTPIDDAALKDVASASYAYGEIYIETSGTAQVLADTDWVQLDLDLGGITGDNGLSRDTTPDEANSQVTVDVAGTYIVEFNGDLNLSEGQTSDSIASYDLQIRINDLATTPPRQARWEIGDGASTSRRHSVSLQGVFELAANDDVSIYIRTNVSDAPIQIAVNRCALGVKMVEPAT